MDTEVYLIYKYKIFVLMIQMLQFYSRPYNMFQMDVCYAKICKCLGAMSIFIHKICFLNTRVLVYCLSLRKYFTVRTSCTTKCVYQIEKSKTLNFLVSRLIFSGHIPTFEMVLLLTSTHSSREFPCIRRCSLIHYCDT